MEILRFYRKRLGLTQVMNDEGNVIPLRETLYDYRITLVDKNHSYRAVLRWAFQRGPAEEFEMTRVERDGRAVLSIRVRPGKAAPGEAPAQGRMLVESAGETHLLRQMQEACAEREPLTARFFEKAFASEGDDFDESDFLEE